jgi:hypothetical protein
LLATRWDTIDLYVNLITMPTSLREKYRVTIGFYLFKRKGKISNRFGSRLCKVEVLEPLTSMVLHGNHLGCLRLNECHYRNAYLLKVCRVEVDFKLLLKGKKRWIHVLKLEVYLKSFKKNKSKNPPIYAPSCTRESMRTCFMLTWRWPLKLSRVCLVRTACLESFLWILFEKS